MTWNIVVPVLATTTIHYDLTWKLSRQHVPLLGSRSRVWFPASKRTKEWKNVRVLKLHIENPAGRNYSQSPVLRRATWSFLWYVLALKTKATIQCCVAVPTRWRRAIRGVETRWAHKSAGLVSYTAAITLSVTHSEVTIWELIYEHTCCLNLAKRQVLHVTRLMSETLPLYSTCFYYVKPLSTRDRVVAPKQINVRVWFRQRVYGCYTKWNTLSYECDKKRFSVRACDTETAPEGRALRNKHDIQQQ